MFMRMTMNLLVLLLQNLVGTPVLLAVASYVLTALALYTVARRRGLKNPWLAWIPVADSWLLGSLSDQYRYVVKGEHTHRRAFLLFFRILTVVLTLSLLGLVGSLCFQVFGGMMRQDVIPDLLLMQIFRQATSLLVVGLPLLGISIAYCVFRFMALYDVYKSMEPENAVLFLVLSILFRITEPFFLFFSRNKDGGMPPRKEPEEAPEEHPNDWVDTQEDEL